MDGALERIFEQWFDYDHATDEDSKKVAKTRRNELILSALADKKIKASVSEFLHHYRDRFREWSVAQGLKTNRRRF